MPIKKDCTKLEIISRNYVTGEAEVAIYPREGYRLLSVAYWREGQTWLFEGEVENLETGHKETFGDVGILKRLI